ncbi:hypothetical protein BAPKO_0087 [Borreliella afzelii PKo]|nr:hypothetical protein BAPKO_0087 [Borreliella afzelii PKo]
MQDPKYFRGLYFSSIFSPFFLCSIASSKASLEMFFSSFKSEIVLAIFSIECVALEDMLSLFRM